MQRSGLSHAVLRAIGIVRSDPSKLFMALTLTGWNRLKGLATERKGKTPEDIARLKARDQAKLVEFHSDAWKHQDVISARRYGSYQDYVAHQAEKLDNSGGEAFRNSQKVVDMFRRRFEMLTELPNHSSVLCLGARRGEEVQAFIGLGHFAIGIDLNPGKGNDYVVRGDFHSLNFSDHSIDCVYVNCLDHAFNLEKVLKEVNRVLKRGGVFVADIVYGYDEGYVVGNHDTMHWAKAREFGNHLAKLSGFSILAFRDLALHGSAFWTQCVMKKP